MLVPIHQTVYKLYRSDTQIEATLGWIVGYIHFQHARKVPQTLLSLSEGAHVKIDLPEELINDVCSKFAEGLSAESVISYVLLMAFILGGKE